jgi:hypothetical protein
MRRRPVTQVALLLLLLLLLLFPLHAEGLSFKPRYKNPGTPQQSLFQTSELDATLRLFTVVGPKFMRI